ncbi:MAG: SAM-dependent methyltransferase, partial [Firmicutes bacterium]|nr:SAM-dependent methyltransferase [Bacillota bacterium]
MERNYNRIELEKEERVDDTGFGGLKLVQRPDEFCYGVDAVLLASAAAESGAFRTIADLGAGTGV